MSVTTPFAANPTGANQLKQFQIATAGLEETFDGKPENFFNFRMDCEDHLVNICDYGSIFDIEHNGATINLLTQYGIVPRERVIAAANARWTDDSPERPKRMSSQALTFFRKSITKELKAQLAIYSDLYKKDGVVFFKLICDLTLPQTREALIKCKLSLQNDNLKLSRFGYDIKELGKYVKMNVNHILACGGQTTDDLIITLFQVYNQAPNEEFCRELGNAYSKWKVGEEISLNLLLLKAENEYQRLKDSDTWGKQSQETSEVIALKAELKQLRNQVNGMKATSQSTGTTNKNSSSKPANAKEKDAQKPNSSSKWRKTPPKAGESQTMKKGEATFHWCDNHKYWNKTHGTADCRGVRKQTVRFADVNIDGKTKSSAQANTAEAAETTGNPPLFGCW